MKNSDIKTLDQFKDIHYGKKGRNIPLNPPSKGELFSAKVS